VNCEETLTAFLLGEQDLEALVYLMGRIRHFLRKAHLNIPRQQRKRFSEAELYKLKYFWAFIKRLFQNGTKSAALLFTSSHTFREVTLVLNPSLSCRLTVFSYKLHFLIGGAVC